jgi:hypothetical protein
MAVIMKRDLHKILKSNICPLCKRVCKSPNGVYRHLLHSHFGDEHGSFWELKTFLMFEGELPIFLKASK